MIKVQKRDGSKEKFNYNKIFNAVSNAFKSCNKEMTADFQDLLYKTFTKDNPRDEKDKLIPLTVETIQDRIQTLLYENGYRDVYDSYIIYRYNHKMTREYVKSQKDFIANYKKSDNNANATIDDNSNVSTKNIGTMNSEAHKKDNISTNRGIMLDRLKECFPGFDHKNYLRDLNHHYIYKHDESSFAGLSPYCVSASMYPFLTNGIQGLGGLSAAPQNLDSFCGIFINWIFAMASQFAGACASPEALVCFDYYARKEWGNDYYLHSDEIITSPLCAKQQTIKSQIHQYFQQIVYSINQPTASRGMQSAFWNVSYFDKPFFEGMFSNFYFPDGTQPIWDSVSWLQKEFMMWFNEERLRVVLTFPVESFAVIYKDGEFLDKDTIDFIAEEYADGHSFFTYISDTVDSLASCCRLRNSLKTKEFNFTNGNMGVMTGSKSVMTLNLNRIIQDFFKTISQTREGSIDIWKNDLNNEIHTNLASFIKDILDRTYKYQTAYNEGLWDMYDANMLPAYKSGFIDLNKQYLTIGINGLNEAAEYLGMTISDNDEYRDFCTHIFKTIKDSNTQHNGKFNEHTITFNTECVPAESLSAKNYNWDKEDGYWVPEDRNLYTSYVFLPSDSKINIFEKIRMHGKNYIGDFLDGGAAAHLNLFEHLSKKQYSYILKYAGDQGCNYLTFNVPNSQCVECGFITKSPISKCPHCGSEHIYYYDRIIGYLTRIDKWSTPRQIEQKTRVYEAPKYLTK
jgi:ribonucleoside-triphosphate reductase (formate)